MLYIKGKINESNEVKTTVNAKICYKYLLKKSVVMKSEKRLPMVIIIHFFMINRASFYKEYFITIQTLKTEKVLNHNII